MALGDALAVCLLEARGFTHDDFAGFIREAHWASDSI
jgi:D-arabinose 5-phosphate isomerase GutQ